MQGLVRGFRGGNASGQAAAGAAASASRHAQRGGMIRAEHSAGGEAISATSPHTEIHEVDVGGLPGEDDFLFVKLSNSEIREALTDMTGMRSTHCAALDHYPDSDSDSTTSFGSDADRQLEIPIVTMNNMLGRLLRTPEVQQAVMSALHNDPDFAHLANGPRNHIEFATGPNGVPLMLPAAAAVVWTEAEDSSPNSMRILLQRISEGLQGLGDSLSAAKNRIGHLFQELAAKIRNDTEEANRSAHASGDVATAGEIPERDPSRAPIYAGVIFQVAVATIALILCRRIVRFAHA